MSTVLGRGQWDIKIEQNHQYSHKRDNITETITGMKEATAQDNNNSDSMWSDDLPWELSSIFSCFISNVFPVHARVYFSPFHNTGHIKITSVNIPSNVGSKSLVYLPLPLP